MPRATALLWNQFWNLFNVANPNTIIIEVPTGEAISKKPTSQLNPYIARFAKRFKLFSAAEVNDPGKRC